MSDDFDASGEVPHRFRPFASVLVAIRFLTRMPVPFVRTLDPPPLAEAMAMFPVAGAVVGLIVGGALVVSDQLGFPPLFSAALAIGLGVMTTGALHEDGLSDVADGFGGGTSQEQRLEIMRDSRIGAYGTIALVLALLARASLFMQLLVAFTAAHVIVLVACAAAFSRALMVDLLWATRPARRDGLSVMAGRPGRVTTLVALAIGGIGAGLAAAYMLNPAQAVLALVAGGISTAIVRGLAMRKIGGQTGDVCGAAQVISEIAMLAVYAATLSLD
jgi:adenosylcobinamide-GDP ribazoletransferase